MCSNTASAGGGGDTLSVTAPANGAKVTVSSAGPGVTVYTDSLGQAVARNIRLGNVYVQASSIDGKFTGATSVDLKRQSVPVTATIALGSYAGVTGYVEAERKADLSPKITSRITALNVTEGSRVKTGDVIVAFNGQPVDDASQF